MSDRDPLLPDDLEPSVDPAERAALATVAEALIAQRPGPRAAFRGELRTRLRELGLARDHPARPAWLWRRVGGFVVSGGGLLGLVALGVGHLGPFAP